MDARHSSQVFVAPPLPTWPKEVYSFEPVHGYFQRLAHKNGLLSVSTLMESMGASGRRPAPEILFKIAEQFPGIDHAQLRASTAVVDHRVHLNGQAFRRGDHSYRSPRVCSGCLTEARYYRNWFDLKILQACPIHNLSLDGQEGDSRLAWWSPEIGIRIDGTPVSSTPVEYSTHWERYVLGRMGVLPQEKIGFLDAHPLFDLTQACLVLGRAIIRRAGKGGEGQRRLSAPRIIRVGFKVLSGGPEGVRAKLREYLPADLNINGQSELRFAMWSSFGWLQELLNSKDDIPLFSEIRTICDETAAEVNIYSRKRIPDFEEVARPLTLKDVADRLNLRPNRVLDIARFLEVVRPGHPFRHWYSFSADEVDRIELTYRELVSRAEAIRLCGISSRRFADLCASGRLRVVTKIGGGSIGCDHFRRSDLVPITQDLGRQDGRIYDIDKRRVLPRRAVRVKSALRLTQVAYALNVCTGTVKELRKLGLLSTASEPCSGSRLMFDPESVCKFRSEYISVGSLAVELQCASVQATSRLKGLRVPLVPLPKGLTSIVRRADVIRVGLLKPQLRCPIDDMWDELEAHWLASGSVCVISKRNGSIVEVTSGGRGAIAELIVRSNRLLFVVTAIEFESPSRFKAFDQRRSAVAEMWPEANIATDIYMGYELFEECKISISEGLSEELLHWIDDRFDKLRWLFSRKHERIGRKISSRPKGAALTQAVMTNAGAGQPGGGSARSIHA